MVMNFILKIIKCKTQAKSKIINQRNFNKYKLKNKIS